MSNLTEQDIIEMEAVFEAQDAEYRATLTPEQLRAYQIHNGEIVAECPKCHAKDVEVTHDGGPDMVGYWWSTSCDACNQVIDSGADGIEAVR
jgi:hypothetical protein